MANKNFPGPNINRLIDTDPQIVKVGMDYYGWGSRASMFGKLKGDVKSNNPAPPHAPEMTVKHVGNEK